MVSETPEPGLYPGTSREVYESWVAVNQSVLNQFRRTPAHARHYLEKSGVDPTPAMRRGTLLHLAVLEPERFASEVTLMPTFNKRTKAGREDFAKFEAEHEGQELVTPAEHAEITAMADSLRSQETARVFFEGQGVNECAFVWKHRETGVPCKALADRLSSIHEWPVLGDVKTTRDAGRKAFERSIYNFGYDVQAAHYLDGLETLYPVDSGKPFRRYFFFLVESEPPYAAAALEEEAIEEGLRKRDRYLRLWAECTSSGRWPGYPAHETVGLPAWAYKEWTDE